MPTDVRPQKIPRDFVRPPGNFNLTVLIFLGALGLLASGTVGTFLLGLARMALVWL